MKLRSAGVCFTLLLLFLLACATKDKDDGQGKSLSAGLTTRGAVNYIHVACRSPVRNVAHKCLRLRKGDKMQEALEDSLDDFDCACQCRHATSCELHAPAPHDAKDDVKLCFREKNKLGDIVRKIMNGRRRSKKAKTHAIALSDRNDENYCYARSTHIRGPRLDSDIEEATAGNFHCPFCHEMHCQCYSKEEETNGDVLEEEIMENEEALATELADVVVEYMSEEEIGDSSSEDFESYYPGIGEVLRDGGNPSGKTDSVDYKEGRE